MLNNHIKLVAFLIEQKCNINCEDKVRNMHHMSYLIIFYCYTQGSFTPVHYAVIHGYCKILEILISYSADLNVKTEVSINCKMKLLSIWHCNVTNTTILLDSSSTLA